MSDVLVRASRAVVLLATVALAGCVVPTSRKVDYIEPPAERIEELAILHLYRPRRFFLGGVDIDVYIDGQLAFELSNGDTTEILVEPGIHLISTASWRSDSQLPIWYYDEHTPELEHEFLPGAHYYLRWYQLSPYEVLSQIQDPDFEARRLQFTDEATFLESQ